MNAHRPLQILALTAIAAVLEAAPLLAAPAVGASAVRSVSDSSDPVSPVDSSAVAASSGAIVVAPSAVGPSAVSPRLGPTTYAVRDGRVSLVLDTFASSLREAEAYLPIPIALGVSGVGRTLRLGTESFTLTDHEGNSVPLAGYRAVQQDYRKRVSDDEVLRAHPMMLDSRFDALDRVASRFFPSPGGRGTRATHVELTSGTWMQDVLYFPRPPAGTHGVMTLTIKGKGMDAPITVRFRVHPPSEGEQLEG